MRRVGEPPPASSPDPRLQRLIALQRSAGNAAVARAVAVRGSVAAPLLQRGYLDQANKAESVRLPVQELLGDVQQIDGVLKALEAYGKLGAVSKPDAVDTALQTLIAAVQDAKAVIGDGNQAIHILGELEAEAHAAHQALVIADGYAYAAQDPVFAGNSEMIAAARRDVKAMRAKYGTKSGRSTQEALFNFIVTVDDKLATAERARVGEIGARAYNYGDPVTGAIDATTQGFLAAFDAIKRFLANKPRVLAHLQPLAAPVNDAPDKLAALKQELRRKEAEAGFGAPKVPLGILPGDVFVSLLRDGTVLDDFGAGLQHGELSHRIQWYAIIDYMQVSGSGVPELKDYTPLDLFKKINETGFSPDRQGNTMWGSVLDAGTNASAATYSAPGTLNRDLLEASPSFEAKGVGLAERDAKYTAPDTKGLESIGDALIQLRALRMKQAEELGGVDGRLWKEYGIPPPALAEQIEKSMSESGAYAISDRGTSEGKEWKVLQEVPARVPALQ